VRIKLVPLQAIIALINPYTKPTATSPESVPAKPYNSVALMIGEQWN
ncbi:MAG: hypothetical protein H6Q12_1598, partial [Bacteroidetes bacterium]|nr:hypothetical protein [Bacteroidota bacterium]